LAGRLTCKLALAIDHIAADTAVLEEDNDLNTDSTSWVARRMIECVSAHQEILREKKEGKRSRAIIDSFFSKRLRWDMQALKVKWKDSA
jgi:hypothetical protein